MVGVLAIVGASGGHDGDAEEFAEAEGEDQAGVGPGEDFAAGLGRGLVAGVVCGVGGPACSEAEDGSAEGEDGAELAGADTHGDVDEGAAVGENAEDDEEDDEGGNPGPELVGVNDFVAEERDDECGDGDDDDTCKAGNVAVHGVQELGTDDGIDAGPSEAGENVEDGDELHAPPSVPKARENHLTQTEFRTKGGEVADGHDTNHVEEEASEDGVDETKVEDFFG